jgi:hypothetical protein
LRSPIPFQESDHVATNYYHFAIESSSLLAIRKS